MIGIISDIHGNYVALAAVLDELDRIGVDKIICLGDVAGYYCQINECCETLKTRNIFSLMGNHDWYLTTGESCPRSNTANRCLNYQRKVIKNANFNWLAALKSKSQIGDINIVHGGWNDPLDEYLEPFSDYFSHIPGCFFASGHTHVPYIWSNADKAYCNPGSVGQPRDGNPQASFAIWEQGIFSLYRVAYDFKSLQQEMKNTGFDSYFYENLSIGARIGGKIDKLAGQHS
jgi:predicted phosphodiesterase